jgi:prepilin-type N-terminal cleavage/methylation domain-containing protein
MERGKKAGFTLIEVIVALASSSVILAGFFIAFSSLNKVSKVSDSELRSVSNADNARMMIKKVLASADVVEYHEVYDPPCCSGEAYNVLAYYKYDSSSPLGSQKLNEYGFFYSAQQQNTDAGYDPSIASDDKVAGSNLYYQRFKKSPGDTTFPENSETGSNAHPNQFDYKAANRHMVMADVADFYADVSAVEMVDTIGDEYSAPVAQRFNIDYQITAAYETEAGTGTAGEKTPTRSMVFKGSTYVMGRVTKQMGRVTGMMLGRVT